MKLYLAPMEGITTFVYRNAIQKYYGGFDRYYTPFLSNKNLNYKEINDVLPSHNEGIDVVPQILTNQADVFLEIAKQLEDYGYKEVNLNLGCPSGTVVAKKRGAGFLAVPDLLDQFLEEIFKQCNLPISIKTRIGIEEWYEWEDLLQIYGKYPIKEFIIHPRFQKEFYKGKAHPDGFLMAEEKMEVPLCYNGDIVSTESFLALIKEYLGHEPEALMLGRGAIANPGLALEIREAQNTEFSNDESKKAEDLSCFKAFHNELLDGYTQLMSGEQPVLFRMKELWAYMGPYRMLTDKQLKQIRKANRMVDYKAIMQEIL